jgi:hypothetical protein
MSRLLRRLIGTFVLLACGSATCFAEGACAVHHNKAPDVVQLSANFSIRGGGDNIKFLGETSTLT